MRRGAGISPFASFTGHSMLATRTGRVTTAPLTVALPMIFASEKPRFKSLDAVRIR